LHNALGFLASAYENGRTTRWLKVKQKDWTIENADGPAWIGPDPDPEDAARR